MLCTLIKNRKLPSAGVDANLGIVIVILGVKVPLEFVYNSLELRISMRA